MRGAAEHPTAFAAVPARRVLPLSISLLLSPAPLYESNDSSEQAAPMPGAMHITIQVIGKNTFGKNPALQMS